VQYKGTWGKRYNHELCKLFNELHVTIYIQMNRLSRAGHIIRMEKSGQSIRCLILDLKALGELEGPK
jgi:hypothetical protein